MWVTPVQTPSLASHQAPVLPHFQRRSLCFGPSPHCVVITSVIGAGYFPVYNPSVTHHCFQDKIQIPLNSLQGYTRFAFTFLSTCVPCFPHSLHQGSAAPGPLSHPAFAHPAPASGSTFPCSSTCCLTNSKNPIKIFLGLIIFL